MRINLKYFVLGAVIACIPVSFYGYLKLGSQSVGISIPKHQIENERVNKIAIDIVPTTLPIPTPTFIKLTSTPTSTNIPPSVKVKTNISVSNIEIRTEVKKTANEIESLIESYAKFYGVDSIVMKAIARCESGYRPEAVNGPYAGIYQFLASTWNSNRRAMGLDENPQLRFNAEESVKTAAFKMSRDGFGAWPVCGRKALARRI
ncbi:hypothetical protein A2955_01895 [Candidatus Woesebacteria bacterium RIFCSPLOWO2_01_FULL_37_19]|uniref:Transglycosylase SLT domain-containing protein n=2 Tax=Candidatus Woeseibacteriota TaxID=1752722 RepID=A0A1F8B0R7_9BACT|nr:MAG: hypothetical protein A2771_00525 [Candidatus Woesebacteria bacterium RIFCSPHIGHO2_01_FULL_38_26b]OGM57602.1 MAG: hypothetical protein A2955_01895 [Candidatus Woesebacteria bacterium RIFCSPLOWO2_01_FULL_37_19]